MGRSRALTCARDTIFAKDCLLSESRFTNKMCPLSVQNVNICYEQRYVFVNVFRYNTKTLTIYFIEHAKIPKNI